jgi:hypothetical protein
MELSAAAALIAGVKPDRILNFMGKYELLAWVDHVRTGKPSARPVGRKIPKRSTNRSLP